MDKSLLNRVVGISIHFKAETGKSPTNLYVGLEEYYQLRVELDHYLWKEPHGKDRPVVMDLKLFRVDADNHLEVS